MKYASGTFWNSSTVLSVRSTLLLWTQVPLLCRLLSLTTRQTDSIQVTAAPSASPPFPLLKLIMGIWMKSYPLSSVAHCTFRLPGLDQQFYIQTLSYMSFIVSGILKQCVRFSRLCLPADMRIRHRHVRTRLHLPDDERGVGRGHWNGHTLQDETRERACVRARA